MNSHIKICLASKSWALALVACLSRMAGKAVAQADDSDLAKKLSDPVAALISIPFQFNFDHRIGRLEKGQCASVILQPVIPIALSHDWNLISRTIIPSVTQSNIFQGAALRIVWAISSRVFSFVQQSHQTMASSGVSGRWSLHRPEQMTSFPGASGALAQLQLSCSRTMSGHMVYWQTISDLLLKNVQMLQVSIQVLSSPLFPTRHPTNGPTH